MNYYFDLHGWLSDEPIEGRSTTVAPPDEPLPDGYAWNHIGVPGREWMTLEKNPVASEVAAPAAPRTVSKLQYMGLFTDNELADIYTAAKSVVAIEVWLAKFNATPDVTGIDLDDPRTLEGLQAMEAAGLLSAGRAAEIIKGGV